MVGLDDFVKHSGIKMGVNKEIAGEKRHLQGDFPVATPTGNVYHGEEDFQPLPLQSHFHFAFFAGLGVDDIPRQFIFSNFLRFMCH